MSLVTAIELQAKLKLSHGCHIVLYSTKTALSKVTYSLKIY